LRLGRVASTPGQVAGEVVPRRRVGIGAHAPEPYQRRVVGHDARAAVADDVGGDTLHDLERHLGVEKHREVVMAVHVDEARRHGQAGSVQVDDPVQARPGAPRGAGTGP
jgi:hypothetical protein